MAISYQGAFDKMQEKGVTTYRIRKENILSQSTLQKMRDGKYVTTETIERLCLLLDCTPNDLMKITPDAHSAGGVSAFALQSVQYFSVLIINTGSWKPMC